MTATTLAALQIGASPAGNDATLDAILGFEDAIRAAGASVVVLPEAVLGGYPKGESFDARIGYRLPTGRRRYGEYFRRAVDVPGPEVETLAGLARCTAASLVVGVVERSGASLFCAALFIDPEMGLIAKHRKLMPTAMERVIWSVGDGSTMPVVSSAAGRLGAAICWENYMPLFRSAMLAKGVDVWCAPTVDDRDMWQATMRHVACEGRCFVVSACQVQPPPTATTADAAGWEPDRMLIRGGSVIVGPLGDVLAGPLYEDSGLVVATIDPDDLAGARLDLDVSGHYSRPDIFTLIVDETPRSGIVFVGPPDTDQLQHPEAVAAQDGPDASC